MAVVIRTQCGARGRGGAPVDDKGTWGICQVDEREGGGGGGGEGRKEK
jgi:hypothetical protein